jgi:uncharacterized membrane protein YjgN (DUF898 family)
LEKSVFCSNIAKKSQNISIMKKNKQIIQIFRFILLFMLIYCANFAIASAQCAMCRASVASNISEGNNLASNLNTGILYLATLPYLVIGVIAWLWYTKSKRNASINSFSKFSQN